MTSFFDMLNESQAIELELFKIKRAKELNIDIMKPIKEEFLQALLSKCIDEGRLEYQRDDRNKCPMSTAWVGDYIQVRLLEELPKHFKMKLRKCPQEEKLLIFSEWLVGNKKAEKTKKAELKPCPFCGKTPYFAENHKDRV